MMIRKIAATAALAAMAASPMTVSAAFPVEPIGPTVTAFTGTPTLVGAGVSVSALGLASLTSDASGNLIGLFPITGGLLDPDLSNTTLARVGSGLRLSRGSVDVDLQNFLIDTTLAVDTTFGSVTSGETFVPFAPLFSLSGLNLVVTDPAGGQPGHLRPRRCPGWLRADQPGRRRARARTLRAAAGRPGPDHA